MSRKHRPASPLSLFAFQDIIMSVTGVFLLLLLIMTLELSARQVSTPDATSKAVAEQLEAAIERTREEIARLSDELEAATANDFDPGNYTQASAEAAIRALREEQRLLRQNQGALTERLASIGSELQAAKEDLDGRAHEVDELDSLREQQAATELELTELKNSQRVFYRSEDEQGRRIFLVELIGEVISVAESGVDQPPLTFRGPDRSRSFMAWAKKLDKSTARFAIIVHRGETVLFKSLHEQLRAAGFAIGFDLLPDDAVAIDPDHGAG